MNTANIKVYRAPGAKLPVYKTTGASGCDFHAHFEGEFREAGKRLDPMERALIPTGIFMDLNDLECQIRPRSGLALDHGITVLNSPGTIDGDYRGEIKILLINLGQEAYTIKHGERIAQGVIGLAIQGIWEEVSSEAELSATERGKGGFGHTGKGLEVKDSVKGQGFHPSEMEVQYISSSTPEEDGFELDETANTFEHIKTIPTEEVAAELNAADVNGDGSVDEKDLSIVHKEYHEQKQIQGGSDTTEREAAEEPVENGTGEKAQADSTDKPKRKSKKSTGNKSDAKQ